jgi:hypothetical protein
MSRRLVLAVAITLLSACSAIPRASSKPWATCAKDQALDLLARDIPSSWPVAVALPAGEPMQTVELGPDPPDAIHDALIRTLHLAPGRNAFYVQQTGGIAGVNKLYGPISLHGRCSAPSLGAP